MNDDLDVGYCFYADGNGYQFILENVYPIEYEITNGYISITTLFDESDILAIFPFEQKTDSIVIDGIIYVIVPDAVSTDGTASA